MSTEINTVVADIIKGAEILEVAADHCAEQSTKEIEQCAAAAAARAYEHALLLLEEGGHEENAREVGRKAEQCFLRANMRSKAREMSDRITRAFMRHRSGNGYWG